MEKISDEELLQELEKRIRNNRQSVSELQELTEQLRTLNKKLEDSERMKSNFLSNIRNEIINPFASILGLSQNILSMKELKPEKVKPLVQLIYSEAFTLDFQLKNIFAAAEVEAGDGIIENIKVDLNVLLQGVIQSISHEAEKKSIEIEINDHSQNQYFITDPSKLQLILLNLISNAIEYSNSGATIKLTKSIENNVLTVVVEDRGIGIDAADHEAIFDRFKRINTSINTLNKGYGLGLSVTKAMLDLLDGKVCVESKRNEGSKFTILIPEASLNQADGFAAEGNEFLFKEEIF